ncbi:helix-hairpin-helix domain-containing protein [Cryptosporangium japonicum]|uniref:DNA-binding protein n=1 Tax=Cryptosporangium japonicum TaxID=80872 RepID=A0ABN0TKC9_9ACTN
MTTPSQGAGLPAIGRPATRALGEAGVRTLEQVASYRRRELLALHGVGPKAVGILAEALAAHGLAFADER